MNHNVIDSEVDYQAFAKKGEAIYQTVKHRYEPHEKGKYLAIEIDSGDFFLAQDGVEAINKAKRVHPGKLFYLLKIGFESVDSIANTSRPSLP